MISNLSTDENLFYEPLGFHDMYFKLGFYNAPIRKDEIEIIWQKDKIVASQPRTAECPRQ